MHVPPQAERMYSDLRLFFVPPFRLHEDIFDGHGEAGQEVTDIQCLPLPKRQRVSGAANDLDLFLERVRHQDAFDAVFQVRRCS